MARKGECWQPAAAGGGDGLRFLMPALPPVHRRLQLSMSRHGPQSSRPSFEYEAQRPTD